MKRIAHLIGAVVMCTMAPLMFAQCDGNACGSIHISQDPCLHINNSSAQKVSVSFQPFGSIASSESKVVQGGETWSPTLPFDGCAQGFVNNIHANFAPNAHANAIANSHSSKVQMTFGPSTRPKDITKPLEGATLWNPETKWQVGKGSGVVAINRNGDGIKKEDLQKKDDCAGEWTTCVATINDPANQNMMVIRNANEPTDAMRRAKECRTDVSTVTCYSSAVLACAPYIACTAP